MSRPTTELAHLFRELRRRRKRPHWASSPIAPAPRNEATSSSLRPCSRPKPTVARATAVRPASKPHGSPPARLWRSSTSPSKPRSRRTPSCTLASSTSSPAKNVILLGTPGTGKSHLSIALGIRACLAGHRVAFKTATEGVALLAEAQRHGRLDNELDRLQRIPVADRRRGRLHPVRPPSGDLISRSSPAATNAPA